MAKTKRVKNKVKFPMTFWSANVVELFERAAYYALFISITLYLSRVVGFSDVDAAWISGAFSAGLYLLPTFSGAIADKIGFRQAIILSFSLLSIGYFSLGLLPEREIVIPSLIVVMIGGSFVKSVITGTVAKSSADATRAKAYSIFYAMVNIGAFTGKTVAYPIRLYLGIQDVYYYAAFMAVIALLLVIFFYKTISTEGEGKSLREVGRGFIRIILNFRLFALILIITGFWIIQQQLYATMPKYVLRTVGEHASPEWIANINPFVVVTMVILITRLMSKFRAVTSMNIGMLIMPVSALCMASSPLLESLTGHSVSIFGLFHAHPVTVMMIIGIVFQGLAECFISPRYLEYFSKQSPKGEEGMYLGFSHLHTFISSILGFGISGYLLVAYCPDPNLAYLQGLNAMQKMPFYSHANYIWYYFSVIGLASAIMLLVYRKVTDYLDSKKAVVSL